MINGKTNLYGGRKILVCLCLIILSFSTAAADIHFDADGKSDLSVYRYGIWYGWRSATNTYFGIQFGAESDQIAPGDYDGDGITDLTVFRPGTGVWYSRRSSDGTLLAVQWGRFPADQPISADYDGDGKTDIAVFRPDDGIWYILTAASNFQQAMYFHWGKAGDTPAPADYDGDGKADFAVYRPTERRWYVCYSSTGNYQAFDFGMSCCTSGVVPADYTGDGKADIALYRPDGFWLIKRSEDGFELSREFGIVGEPPINPVPGDYDGDGITDLGIFYRGTWFTYQSRTSTQINYQFGQFGGDRPLQNFYYRR